jgi:hypothetical protein
VIICAVLATLSGSSALPPPEGSRSRFAADAQIITGQELIAWAI